MSGNAEGEDPTTMNDRARYFVRYGGARCCGKTMALKDELVDRVAGVVIATALVAAGVRPAGRMRRRLRRAQARLDAFKAAHLEVPT